MAVARRPASIIRFVLRAQRLPALLHEQPDRLRRDRVHRDHPAPRCAGYALSRFTFRGKYWIVALMLLTQMFPLVMLVAPIFKMLSPLGLTNSLTGLVIVYTAFNVPFATFLMQSFFDGIPKDLEEAAMIDGATRFARLPPDHPAADAARHRRDARLRLHRRLERAAVRADADLQATTQRPSRSGCSPSSRNSRSISGR